MNLPLSFGAALEITHEESGRRGLGGTHEVFALYAGGDRQTEGAAYAAIMQALPAMKRLAKRAGIPSRLKLLIHEDGHATWHSSSRRKRAGLPVG